MAHFTSWKQSMMALKSQFVESSGHLMTGCVLPAVFEIGCLVIRNERDDARPKPSWCIEAL
jgi:hypothetical protein